MIDYTLTENQDILKGLLHEPTPVCIVFTKVNGDRREMECTLHGSYFTENPAKENSSRSVPTTSLSVWDINAAGWRSFRWANIIEVKRGSTKNSSVVEVRN